MTTFKAASREAELYCAQCREYDRPRLANETFPEGVICKTDIAYIDVNQILRDGVITDENT